jgi:hypothetical protein
MRAIQEPVFSVANTDFEGGDNDNGYGDLIFLVKHGQPSHTCIVHNKVLFEKISRPGNTYLHYLPLPPLPVQCAVRTVLLICTKLLLCCTVGILAYYRQNNARIIGVGNFPFLNRNRNRKSFRYRYSRKFASESWRRFSIEQRFNPGLLYVVFSWPNQLHYSI